MVLERCKGDVDRSIALVEKLVRKQARQQQRRRARERADDDNDDDNDDTRRPYVARVMRSYDAADGGGRLRLQRGALVRNVVATGDAQWLRGECERADDTVEQGVFPSVCVRDTALDVRVRAAMPFAPAKANQLAFAAGDELTLLSRIAGFDWWYAVDGRGVCGRVPITLLRVESNQAQYELQRALGEQAATAAASVEPTTMPPSSVDSALQRAASPDALQSPWFRRAEQETGAAVDNDDDTENWLNAMEELLGMNFAGEPAVVRVLQLSDDDALRIEANLCKLEKCV